MHKITFALNDTIFFTTGKLDVGCNGYTLGNARITISKPKNPPYLYKWSTGQTTSFIDNLIVGEYDVTVTDALLNDTTVRFIINEKECELNPEIIFTPNGDGINDSWFIDNYNYFPDALVLVYNRWGQKVFEQYGQYHIPWDGTDLVGVKVPDSSYFYIIYKDTKKEKELKKGTVTILR